MFRKLISKILEIPLVYRLSQLLLGPGVNTLLPRKIKSVVDSFPTPKSVLDVACGPSSWLWKVGVRPTGLDVSQNYVKDFSKGGCNGVVASSLEIPFQKESFDAIWSIGLFHHLTEDESRKTIAEMQRVLQADGYLILFDGVYPRNSLTRPIAWGLRKSDRGLYMRKQEELEALLPSRDLWQVKRVTYSYFGHEGLFCIFKKNAQIQNQV